VQEPVIEARSLKKVYGSVSALSDLSFTVAPGDFVALLGPNGAGKTTALHLLLGLLKPTQGEVRIFGLDPLREKYRIYPRINFSSCEIKLPFNLTVRQNLLIYARLYGTPQPREKVDRLLELVGLSHLAYTLAGKLSSGEQSRLNLCKALINDPELLLLDEPTANLDPDMADRMRTLLKKLHQEHSLTILYTSHNMSEVQSLCRRILFIQHGTKVAEGSAEDILRRYGKNNLEEVFIHLARPQTTRTP
jgi:ABC-2 type transport system ATP-binding protein